MSLCSGSIITGHSSLTSYFPPSVILIIFRNDWWLPCGIAGFIAGLFRRKNSGSTEYQYWVMEVYMYVHVHVCNMYCTCMYVLHGLLEIRMHSGPRAKFMHLRRGRPSCACACQLTTFLIVTDTYICTYICT